MGSGGLRRSCVSCRWRDSKRRPILTQAHGCAIIQHSGRLVRVISRRATALEGVMEGIHRLIFSLVVASTTVGCGATESAIETRAESLEGTQVQVDTDNQFVSAVKFNAVVEGVGHTICGGVIISPTRVMSAAHCLHEDMDNLRVIGEIVGFGEASLSIPAEPNLGDRYITLTDDWGEGYLGGSDDLVVVQFPRRFDLIGFPPAKPTPASVAEWSHFALLADLVGYGQEGDGPREFGPRDQSTIEPDDGLLVLPAGGGTEYLQGESGGPLYFTALDDTFASEGIHSGDLVVAGILTNISPFGTSAVVDIGANRIWTTTAALEPSDTVVYAWGSVGLNDRVRLYEEPRPPDGSYEPPPASIANAWTSTVSLGADTSVGDVFALGSVMLRSRAHARRIWTEGSVSQQADAEAAEVVEDVDAALFTYRGFSVAFPSVPGMNDRVAGLGEVVAAPPDVHNKKLSMHSGSTLVFAAGNYFFDELLIEPSVNVQLPASGLTRIYTGSFTSRSVFGTQERADSVLVAVISSSYRTTSIEEWFYGTLIVPNGRIRLASPGCTICSQYTGGFYARDVEVHQGAHLVRAPFVGDWLPL